MASLALAFDILARDKASKEFDKVSKSASLTGSKLDNLTNRGLKGLAVGAGVAAAGGIAALGAALVTGVKDAASYQKLADQTAAVLKSTGNVAHQSVKGIQARAASLESLSGVDEETIIHGQNVLATFTNVRDGVGKGNDIFNQATTAALNMSSALGTDMQGSAIQLGKALNDPVKGITALSRVGVSFTEDQKKQIAAMVKAGDTMGAQKLILGELNKEFGGAAKAAGQGFEGAMARAQDAVGDAFRAIGQKLLPTVTKLADYVAKNAGPAIDKFGDFLSTHIAPAIGVVVGKIGDFIEAFKFGDEWESHSWVESLAVQIRGLVDGFKNGTGAGGLIRDALKKLGDVVVSVTGFLSRHGTAVQVVVAALLGGLTAFKLITTAVRIYTGVQAALNVVLSANPIGLVIIAVAALVAGIIVAYKKSETFRNIVKGAFDAIGAAARFMWNNVVAPVIRFLLDAFVKVTGFYATLLRGLSKVPGFGWAKGAAEKLQNVADKAAGIKNNIHDIPSKKDVTVNFHVNGAGQVTLANGVKVDVGQFRARAGGGPVMPGQLYQVGDNPDGSWNKTTELFAPTQPGRIFNQRQLAEAVAGGRGGGGKTDLSEASLARLAQILSGVRLENRISFRQLDYAMGLG